MEREGERERENLEIHVGLPITTYPRDHCHRVDFYKRYFNVNMSNTECRTKSSCQLQYTQHLIPRASRDTLI